MPESEALPASEPPSPLPEWAQRRKRNCTRRGRADLSVFLWPTQEDMLASPAPPALKVVGPQLLPWPLHAPSGHQTMQPELAIAPVMPSGHSHMHASNMGKIEGTSMSVAHPSASHAPPFVLQQRLHAHPDAAAHAHLPSAAPAAQGVNIKAEPAASQLASALGSLEQEPLLRQLRDHLSRTAAAGGTAGAAGTAGNAAAGGAAVGPHHTGAFHAGGGGVGMSVVDVSGRSGATAQRNQGAAVLQDWNLPQQTQHPSAPLDSLKGALQQLQQRAGHVTQGALQTSTQHQGVHDPAAAAPSSLHAAGQGQVPPTSTTGHDAQLHAQLQSQLLAALGGGASSHESRRDVMALVQMLKNNGGKLGGTPTQAQSLTAAGTLKKPFPTTNVANGQQQGTQATAQQHAMHHQVQQRFTIDSAGPASRQLSGGAPPPSRPLSAADTNGPVTLSSLCKPAAQAPTSQVSQVPSKDAAAALLRHFGLSAGASAPRSAPAAAMHASSATHAQQPTARSVHGRQSDWGHDNSGPSAFSEPLEAPATGGAAGGPSSPQFSPEHLHILQTLAAVEQQRNREAAVSAAAQLVSTQGAQFSLPGTDQPGQHAAHALIAQQLQQNQSSAVMAPNATSTQLQQQPDGPHMLPLLQQVVNASRQASAGTQAAVTREECSRHNSSAAQDLISHLSQQNAQQNAASAAHSSAVLSYELKNHMLQQLSQQVSQSNPTDGSGAAADASNISTLRVAAAAQRSASASGLDDLSARQRPSHDGSAGGSPPAQPSSMPPSSLSQQQQQQQSHMHASRGIAAQSNASLQPHQQVDAAESRLAAQSPAQLLSQLHSLQSATGAQPPAVPMSGSAFASACLLYTSDAADE